MVKQSHPNGNGRKRKIMSELSVGLTPEMESLLQFATDASGIPPSIWGRIAIAEKLFRDEWPQRAQQFIQAAGK